MTVDVAPDGAVHETVHEAVDEAVRGAAALHDVTVLPGGPRGGGWTGYLDAVHPDRIHRLLAGAGTRCGGCPTRTARTAAEALLLGDVTAALAAPVGAVLVGHGRGLVVDPAHVWLRFGADGVQALALDTAALWVTAGDPLAGRRGTREAAGAAQLHRVVTEGYARLLEPMLEAAQGVVRRGRRALWAEATERLAYAVFDASRRLGAGDRAPAAVAELLAAAPADLRRPVRWLEVPVAGGRRVTWKARNLCCLAYQTPRWRGEYCATCPAVPAGEAVRRLRETAAG